MAVTGFNTVIYSIGYRDEINGWSELQDQQHTVLKADLIFRSAFNTDTDFI